MDANTAMKELEREIEQKEDEFGGLELLSKTAAEIRTRTQYAGRAEAAEAELNILRRRLEQMKRPE